jgi:hypothetical protein
MGVFDAFGKKKQEPEKSAGGSVIHRYSEEKWGRPEVGLPEERVWQFREQRDAVYLRRFGEAKTVSHEAIPLIPHIDVMEYYRTDKGGRVCTLVTSGMSDLAMNAPANANARRVELIFYCTEPMQEYINAMRWLAHFPHDQKTWIGDFHTIPVKPGWCSPILDTCFLLPSIVKKDTDLHEELIFDGDGVHFLWIVPITAAESTLKLKKGSGALLDLFTQNRHPYIFDAARKSYV